MKRSQEAFSGFTLIELVITIVILAIIMILAAPSFVDVLDRRRVVDAVETMVKQVHQARAVAIETNREILMVFREEDGASSLGWDWCFGLTDDPDGCECAPDATTDVCEIPLSFVFADATAEDRVVVRASGDQFANRVQLTVLPDDLLFEALRGLRVDDGGTTESIEFESARGRQARVVVNRLGRASTCSPDGTVETMRACPP